MRQPIHLQNLRKIPSKNQRNLLVLNHRKKLQHHPRNQPMKMKIPKTKVRKQSSGFENGGYDDNEEVNSDRGSETDGRSRSSSVESSPVVYTINNDDSGQNNVVTVKKTDL